MKMQRTHETYERTDIVKNALQTRTHNNTAHENVRIIPLA